LPQPDVHTITFRDVIAGVIAVMVVGAICWSALYDGSQASGTALVGAMGSVAAWLFRGSTMQQNNNGNGNGTEKPPVPPPPGTP
jgi:hypothetical protein